MSNDQARKKWEDLITWMLTQDGFAVIGLKDQVVTVQTNLDPEILCDVSSLVFEATLNEVGELPDVNQLH